MQPKASCANYEFVKEVLERHLKATSELLTNLSDYGRPLTTSEKATIREIFAGEWYREITSELRFAFYDGNAKMAEDVTHTILNTLADLS